MTIQVITRNVRNTIINEEYDLITTTVQEVRDKLLEVYNKINPNLDVSFFELESDAHQKFKDFIRFVDVYRSYNQIEINRTPTYDDYVKQLIFKSEPISEAVAHNIKLFEEEERYRHKYRKEINYLAALENGFLEVEEDENGNWYLLDGFRRLFVNDGLGDTVVFVKKYKKLSVSQWLKFMINANFWKTAYSSSFVGAFNRGFMFSLYCREGITLFELPDFFMNAINNYLGSGDTFKSSNQLSAFTIKAYTEKNEIFMEDMKLIRDLYEYFNTQEFTVYGGRGNKTVKEVFSLNTILYNKPREYLHKEYTLKFVCNAVTGIIGEVRRYEFRNNLPRKAFDINAFKEFLTNNDFIKLLSKFKDMTVTGHLENSVELNFVPPLRIHMIKSMDYDLKEVLFATFGQDTFKSYIRKYHPDVLSPEDIQPSTPITDWSKVKM